jgi:hypothetical protein
MATTPTEPAAFSTRITADARNGGLSGCGSIPHGTRRRCGHRGGQPGSSPMRRSLPWSSRYYRSLPRLPRFGSGSGGVSGRGR